MATETATAPISTNNPPRVLSWLRCQVEPGLFPDEYAIWGDTSDGRPYSLFAPLAVVRPPTNVERGEGSVRVILLERTGDVVLVKLPDESFEGGSAFITVRANQLVS